MKKETPSGSKPRLVVVGVEAGVREGLLAVLSGHGAWIEISADLVDVQRRHDVQAFDAVILDSRQLAPGDGARLSALRAGLEAPEILLLAVAGRVDGLPGISDVIETPIVASRLRATLDRALERRRLRRQVDTLRARLGEAAPCELIGQSAAIAELRHRVEALAAAPDAPVLVLGEAGTGKELAARCIHHRSSRRDSPFVVVNCAALSEGQLEAALFGHEPGAFADATRAGREGLLAGTGSVFLDEVGELPVHLQARLLRVLADGVWRRVGGVQDRPVRCRLLAANRHDPAELVASGAFRPDLLQRLGAITLRLPPLRQRADDVPLLAHCFLDHFGRQMGKALTGFSEDALETLSEHGWPGNVRELRNAIELAAIHCDAGLIEEEHLPRWDGGLPGTNDVIPRDHVDLPDGDRSLRSVEKIMVGRVLDETHWNISKAAALLGINRTTLYNKIKLYGLGQRPLAERTR